MQKRLRLSAFCILRSAFVLMACTREHATVFPHAPVILISVDTLRSDHLPVYGYRAVATPHIDAFRRDAILFQRAYSHCPMTLPSHVSILTGLLPTEHGVRNNIGYRFDGSKFRTLAKVLAANGYRTGAAVSAYVLRAETGIADGFESYEDSIAATGTAVAELRRPGSQTLTYANDWIRRNASQPLFFFFHIYEPHAPYATSYDGEIAKSDAIVGALLAELKRLRIYDGALIVFLSDHGEGLGQHGEDEHGILLYREALQVPLLIKLPESRRAGETVQYPVALADVAPTILTLLGIEQSKRTLFTQSRNATYSETLYPRLHLGWSDLQSMIDGRSHYIAGPRPELYDILADPAETRDLVAVDRRDAARLRDQLVRSATAIAPLENINAEEAAKLAALGYVGSAKNRAGPLPNPRDVISSLREIKSAFALAATRRDDDAVIALRALLSRNPRLTDAWAKLGEVLTDSGLYDEAIAAYKAALTQTAQPDSELLLGLARVYLLSGRPGDAIAHAELASRVSPREAHESLARAFAMKHRFADAEEQVRLARMDGHEQPATILLLAEVQRDEGNLRAALETIATAEQRANELKIPHLSGADYLRGDILARLDRPDEAVAAYQREIAASPEHLQAYANLAVIYRIEEKRADADKALEAMVRNNPHRGARSLAAKTRAALGMY